MNRQGYEYLENPSSCEAYVVIPKQNNMGRDKYIDLCLRTSTVMVRTIDNLVLTGVQVPKEQLHEIDFPEFDDEVGSLVGVCIDPITNVGRVFGIFKPQSLENYIEVEGQYRNAKLWKDSGFDFNMFADGGFMVFTLLQKDGYGSTFKVLNPNNLASYKMYIQGEFEVYASNNINILSEKILNVRVKDNESDSEGFSMTYVLGEGLNMKDEFNNKITSNSEGVTVETENGNYFQVGKDGFVLKSEASNYKDFMNSLLDEITQAVIMTPVGPGSISPKTIAKIQQLKSDFNQIF